jgi:hypothetical protein
MKHPKPPTTQKLGSINRNEVLPMREAARRMGWAARMAADVQKMGLPTVTIGRLKYTTGRAVYDFVAARLAALAKSDEGDDQ